MTISVWISLALALLGIAKAIVSWRAGANAADSVRAQLILKSLEEMDARLNKAGSAADAARDRYRSGELPDDDIGFRD